MKRYMCIGGYFLTCLVVGVFSCFISGIFSIYQFLQLSYDDERQFVYGILIVWAISKVTAAIKYISKMQYDIGSILYGLVLLVLQSEWIMNVKEQEDYEKSYILAFIYQIIINNFPFIICNIYLLSDTTRNIDHGYYIALIFIYYIFIGIMINLAFYENQEFDTEPDLYSTLVFLPSIPINFCFWYLLIQSFNFNWIIGVCLLLGNLILGIFDFLFFKENQNDQLEKRHQILYKILQYQFQFNLVFLNNFPQSYYYYIKLRSWSQLFASIIQCLNIILLLTIKLVYYPLIIQTDKAFYTFLALSTFQICYLLINIYHKLTKPNEYKLQLKCKEKEISIEKKAYYLLSSRFTINYVIEIEIDFLCLFDEHKNQFNKSLLTIKNFIIEAIEKTENKNKILIQDIKQQIKLLFIVEKKSSQDPLKQSIQIGDKFFDEDQNLQMLKNLCLILPNNKVVEFQIDNKIQKVESLMIQISSFNNNQFIFKKNKNSEFKINASIQSFRNEIASFHYSNLVFYNKISEILQISPQIVLFDLFDEIS